jgi:hypothetical protein
MWYEEAFSQIGEQKLLDLDLLLTPHLENPQEAVTRIQRTLKGMMKRGR